MRGGRRPGSITVWRTGSITGRQTGFHVCIPIGRGNNSREWKIDQSGFR